MFYLVSTELVGEHLLGDFSFKVDPEAPAGDAWIACYRPNSVTKIGDIHVKYRYYSFQTFVSALKDSKMGLLKSLTHTTITPEVATAMMHYAIQKERHQRISTYTIAQEVENTSKPTQLFRFDSQASKLLVALLKDVGNSWVSKVFGELIQQVCENEVCEVDPTKLGPEDDLEKNAKVFEELCKTFLDTILLENTTTRPVPPDVLKISCEIHSVVSTKFKDYATQAVGGIIFLRWICPLITIPPPSIIHPDKLTVDGRRSLLLVSKVIQACVNQVQFEVKENYMVRFNPLLTIYTPKIQNFVSELAAQRPYVPPLRSRKHYTDTLEKLDLLVQHTHQNWETVVSRLFSYCKTPDEEMDMMCWSGDLAKNLDDLVTCLQSTPK
eukprot:TRINITY_DN4037_c1_g1_i7.p1 TRINITY_DN4037_c1_g1~~TRINITY_DN4037_c1_g1_i7.p1  ORF type:complete len:382 (-),score=67.88 TRINITY_DN4037_c1_g1_i7:114-1259(-)